MKDRARDYYERDIAGHEFPHFTNSELVKLQQEAQDGNTESWHKLWLHGVRLVTKLAKNLMDKGLMTVQEYDDVVGEGNLALGEAIPNWTPNRGRYSTFVWTVVRNKVLTYLDKQYRRGFTGEFDVDELQTTPLVKEFQFGNHEIFYTTDYEEGVATASPEALVITQRDLETALIAGDLTSEEIALLNDTFYKDRGQAEIAEELGVSQATISRRLERIYEKLRPILA